MDISRAVTLHRFWVRTSFTGVLFAWIGIFASLVWLYGDVERGFVSMVYIYALAHIVILFVTPFVGEHLRSGVRRLLALGTLLLALGLSFVGATMVNAEAMEYVFWYGLLFGVVWGLYRALYAFPYSLHVHSIHDAHRELVLAAIPFAAACTLVLSSFAFVVVIFTLCALCALIPLSYLPEHTEKYDWSLFETWEQLFIPYNRTFVVHGIAQGIERTTLFFVWPLMILLFSSSVLVFGLLMTLTLCATYYSRTYVRRFFAWLQVHRSKTVAYTSIVTIWALRAFSATPAAVLITTTASSLLPHAHQHHDSEVFVDEYSALREISAAIGAIITCAAAVVLAMYVSLPAVFFGLCICAACAALFAYRIQRRTDARI